MKVVIDIDKEYYELLKYEVDVCHNDYKPIALIAKGKPLPKGYGRLIDADALKQVYENTEDAEVCKWTLYGVTSEIDDAETIIEAESEV